MMSQKLGEYMEQYRESEQSLQNSRPLHDSIGRSAVAWMDDALCAQIDPEIPFPEKGGRSPMKK